MIGALTGSYPESRPLRPDPLGPPGLRRGDESAAGARAGVLAARWCRGGVEHGGGVGKIGAGVRHPTRCGGVKVSEQRDSDKLTDDMAQRIDELGVPRGELYLAAIELARAQLRQVDGLLADLQAVIERRAERDARESGE